MNESLSPDVLAYHQEMVALHRRAAIAWAEWTRFLARHYQLGQGDNIAEDGAIVRKPIVPVDVPSGSGGTAS